MSNEINSVDFNGLTAKEQAIVSQAIGWDGKEYFDAKTGIRIELVDGDVASYRVLDKGDQEELPEQETVQASEPELQAPEVTPEPEVETPATETETSEPTDVASEQDTAEPTPENGEVTDSAPADTANEPAPTE